MLFPAIVKASRLTMDARNVPIITVTITCYVLSVFNCSALPCPSAPFACPCSCGSLQPIQQERRQQVLRAYAVNGHKFLKGGSRSWVRLKNGLDG